MLVGEDGVCLVRVGLGQSRQLLGDLLEVARKDAAYALEKDPELITERGQALRTLLYLYRRDEAIRFLRAG